VQEFRWDKVGVVRARDCNFFYGKDSLHEDEQQVFYHLCKYHTKILLADFNAKVGTENVFKKSGNEGLQQE
jgi:hypothetical protein